MPFLGAGASLASQTTGPSLPSGRALADELVDAMAGAFVDHTGIRELPKIAQFYEQSVFDREALYAYLHDRFEAQQRTHSPGVVAAALAGLSRDQNLFMITTNYDTLVERAFGSAARPIAVITQNMRDPVRGATGIHLIRPDGTETTSDSVDFQWSDKSFPAGCAFLFKMHGSAHRREPEARDDIIITEDDYVDFMVNSGGTVSPYFPPASLTAAYKQRRFLFIGYSLSDWNFRAFLRVLTLRNAISGRPARRHWAVQLRPSPLEAELWSHRNVNLYDGDLKDFCERLEAAGAP